MNKQLLQYKGLYGDDQLPYMPDFIHIESLKHRSKRYNWEIADHAHSELFQLFIIRSGKGLLVSEDTELPISGPSIITVPANHLHGFHFQSDIRGKVMTLSDGYLDGILKDKPHVHLSVNQMGQSLFDEGEGLFDEILYLMDQIEKELIEDALEKQMGLRSYFELLFLMLYRKRYRSDQSDISTNLKSLAYFQQFKKLVKQSLQNPLTIKEYANKLGITQMHLNRVCHAVVNESALKVVQRFLMGEAKKYLLNTSYSIAEISYFLNFNDPAYFGRLFKKLVGVSPGGFRKE